jgi:DNA-binding MarR family transcriptional regulator
MNRDLRSEIRQTRPFGSLEQEAALNLRRTADLMDQQVTDLLRGASLTPTQYNVLRILRGAGASGLAAGEIGERMLTRGCDITRLLDRLETQGLLQRSRGKEDRRVVTVTITQGGLDLLAELDSPMAVLHVRQLHHLGPAKLRQLIELLGEARQGHAQEPRTTT